MLGRTKIEINFVYKIIVGNVPLINKLQNQQNI